MVISRLSVIIKLNLCWLTVSMLNGLSQGRIQLCRHSAKLMNPQQVNQQVALLRNLKHGVGVK